VAVIDWLLDSDPSIRWRVMRDLTGAPAGEVLGERARVATEGVKQSQAAEVERGPKGGGRRLARQFDDTNAQKVGYNSSARRSRGL